MKIMAHYPRTATGMDGTLTLIFQKSEIYPKMPMFEQLKKQVPVGKIYETIQKT